MLADLESAAFQVGSERENRCSATCLVSVIVRVQFGDGGFDTGWPGKRWATARVKMTNAVANWVRAPISPEPAIRPKPMLTTKNPRAIAVSQGAPIIATTKVNVAMPADMRPM